MQKDMAKVFCILTFFLLFVFPTSLEAATLSIQPKTGSFPARERITVKVIVIPNIIPFNAVSGVVYFPTNIFTIESISKATSVLDFWVTEPEITRSEGTVKFEGVALGGFYGSAATVISVNLLTLNPGSGRVVFRSGQILANDGSGTDITKNLEGAIFYVTEVAPKKVVPVEPEPAIEVPQPVMGLGAARAFRPQYTSYPWLQFSQDTRNLQMVLSRWASNLVVDGKLGPKTCAALRMALDQYARMGWKVPNYLNWAHQSCAQHGVGQTDEKKESAPAANMFVIAAAAGLAVGLFAALAFPRRA